MKRRLRGAALTLALAGAISNVPSAMADESGIAPQNDPLAAEAGRHFRRGVELYGEANYTAALVEFKRACALAPTATAMYNLGETQFQLQDYAAALKTFRRYLAEFGPSESHRAAVARAVETLRTRVGYLKVTTVPAGADIAVDDEGVGQTPVSEPLLVSMGRRKVVASMAGRGAVTEYVDVAAEDHVSVSLQLRPPAVNSAPVSVAEAQGTPNPEGHPSRGVPVTTLRLAGWIAAGTLAAGAVTFGTLALGESQSLANERNAFPANSAVLSRDANRTATYSILADSFAAAAIIVGAVSLYWTLSPAVDHATTSTQARVTLAPGSARFEMTF
jgi:tetratricopeptide (TPR) repeat protein